MTRDEADKLIAENNAVTRPFVIERFGKMADMPESAMYDVRGPGLPSGGYVVCGLDEAQRWACKFAAVFIAGERSGFAEAKQVHDEVYAKSGAD